MAMTIIPNWLSSLPPNTWTSHEIITNSIAADTTVATAEQVYMTMMEALYAVTTCEDVAVEFKKFARRCIDFNQGNQSDFERYFKSKYNEAEREATTIPAGQWRSFNVGYFQAF
jgi:hypothetical protein